MRDSQAQGIKEYDLNLANAIMLAAEHAPQSSGREPSKNKKQGDRYKAFSHGEIILMKRLHRSGIWSIAKLAKENGTTAGRIKAVLT